MSMKKHEAEKLINETFNAPYNESQFRYFIKELFDEFEPRDKTYSGQYIWDAFKGDIISYTRIGKFLDPEGVKIDILAVKVKNRRTLENARTMQRNFIARYLNGGRGDDLKDAALIAFYSDDSEDWRFSLVKMDYALDEQKQKIRKELTPARRYSFLVGKHEKTHTARKQLLPILQSQTETTLAELEIAFNIETVTKEFFEKYKALYLDLKETLEKHLDKDKKTKVEFEAKTIKTEDFAKRLLGQIVFLYFLQKKGWLGVAKGQNWGTGPKDFLQALYRGEYGEYQNFFNDVLEPLFYEALATERHDNYYDHLKCRIPFLNGGLFEAIRNYDWVNTDILLDNSTFKEIFEIFDLYNFTVREDEPLDREVAVDPEMLGKVFENLIPENERKGSGTFYTPREIVHYMCQESLINYLDAKLNIESRPVEERGQQSLLPDFTQTDLLTKYEDVYAPVVQREDLAEFIYHGDVAQEHDATAEVKNQREDYKGTYQHRIPESVRKNAQQIDDALAHVKICDPAIGSGAFPVGVMNEIVRARGSLNAYLKEECRTPYDFKRHAIQESIYGVDLEPSAVDIAKLRLWLSLVVDEDDFSSIKPLPNLEYKIMAGDSLIGEMSQKDMAYKGWLDELADLQKSIFSEYSLSKKDATKIKINTLLDNLFQGYDGEFRFNYWIQFHEIMDRGGFDIVIGNPPYVSSKGTTDDQKVLYKKEFGFSDDLYNYFFIRSFDISKINGIVTLITSNTYLTLQTKKNIREILQSNRVIKIVNLGANVFENAMVDTAISFTRKAEDKDYKLDFIDACESFKKPNLYSVNIEIYKSAVNHVFFPPSDFNMRMYKKYNSSISGIHQKFWSLIKTSKNVTRSMVSLEKYRETLRPSDVTLIGLISDGGVGLQTGNNGFFIGVRTGSKEADNVQSSRPKKLLESIYKPKKKEWGVQGLNSIKTLPEAKNFLQKKSETEIRELFDSLKEKYHRDIFGQGYIFRIVSTNEIADPSKLSDYEKENGIPQGKATFIPYDKGDKDGNRWYLQTPYFIDWSEDAVKTLKTSKLARWQGYNFFFKKGFCWTDVHTLLIKARLKGETVNDVKSMSLSSLSNQTPSEYLCCILNSTFISEYVHHFINNTQTFQMNDARQIPIIIPDDTQLKLFKSIFDRAYQTKEDQFSGKITTEEANKRLENIQNTLDKLVCELYGLTSEEIAIVDETVK